MTRVTRFLFASLFTVTLTLTLAACAALPDDSPVVEQLDVETGATVARLGRPVELYRETFAQDATGRFAFLGPFETNQMGTRALFLWVAVPIESPADAEPPTVELNGKPLALGAPGNTAEFAALKTSPYKLPTPWSSTYYYKIDAELARMLGGAATLALSVGESTKDGTVRTSFKTQVEGDPRLAAFAARE